MPTFLKKPIFEGVATALITPFLNDKVDYDALSFLIDYQIKNEVSALVLLGTTGEPCTVTYEEYEEIIKFSVSKINHRIPLLIGAGSNSTEICIKKALVCQNYGVDGLLMVTPYYNKCTQNGLICHYSSIAAKTNLPIIIYNVPSRTGLNILPETALQLSKIENIVGLKDACANPYQTVKTSELLSGIMPIYSGDDEENLRIYKLGGFGCISVVSNIYPKEVVNIYNTFKNNKAEAEYLQNKINKINKVFFIEVNPIPVKCAAEIKGLCSSRTRLPLTPIEANHFAQLINCMKEYEGEIK